MLACGVLRSNDKEACYISLAVYMVGLTILWGILFISEMFIVYYSSRGSILSVADRQPIEFISYFRLGMCS